MNVLKYAALETERQSGTPMEVWGMVEAHEYLYGRALARLDETTIQVLQAQIKRRTSTGYRVVPATFNQGPPAVGPQHVPQAMKALVEAQDQMDEYQLALELLLIHPFADGNGRVASLIFNWKAGTLNDPVQLPPWPELQERGNFSYQWARDLSKGQE